MNCPHYGYWKSLKHFRDAYPDTPGRKLLGLIANGHASLCKPRLPSHQRAELNSQGRWVIKLVDDITPVKRRHYAPPVFKLAVDPLRVDYARQVRQFTLAKPALKRVRMMRPESVNTLAHL